MNINNCHDKGYKDLFSNKEAFITLIRSFVDEDWVDKIDFKNLEYVNKSFILHDFKEKEADVVYRLNFSGKNVYFYCLLEFQSTVDKQMPIRLLFYMNEIWRDYIKNKENFKKLPAIIPLVLYNGKRRWNVPISFKEMIDGYEIFGKNIVDFEYKLFDVIRYNEKDLLKLSNLVASVFLLDKQTDLNIIANKLDKLIGVMKKLNDKEIIFFKRWLKFILKNNISEENYEEFDNILDENVKLEVEQMVSNFGQLIKKGFEDSEQKGIEKGIEQGIEEGKFEIALNLLDILDDKTISKKTGISIDKIKALRKTNKSKEDEEN